MIKSVEFQNFKILRKAILPLGPFTLVVGANGSGKSTAIQAIRNLSMPSALNYQDVISVGLPRSVPARVVCNWDVKPGGTTTDVWAFNGTHGPENRGGDIPEQSAFLQKIRDYSLSPEAIARPVVLMPYMELARDGTSLAGVLDRLRDSHPERFEALNMELGRWLPEFDRVVFNTPQQGTRSVSLRTKIGSHSIPASGLSQGTLLALAMLTLAYLPEPPSIVCLEDPDRGLHPRLLRDVRDALYRLCYPESYQEKRKPVQVVATTHSPILLSLFKEHLDEVVLAHKKGEEAVFQRLADLPDIERILKGADLGEVWYTGILGGVPTPAQG